MHPILSHAAEQHTTHNIFEINEKHLDLNCQNIVQTKKILKRSNVSYKVHRI